MPGAPGLEAFELDPERERQAFLDRYGTALFDLLERGTYLERTDVEEFFALAVPGIDELAALRRCMVLLEDERGVVVDTAPTGHTLRLFDLPGVVRRWLAAFGAMEAKHRAVVEALTGAYRADEAAQALAELAADLDRLEAAWRDPARTAALVVARPEPVAWEEAVRTVAELRSRGFAVAGLLLNRATAAPPTPPPADVPVAFLPPWPEDPVGVPALRSLAAAVRTAPAAAPPAVQPAPAASRFLPPPYRLAVVAGKGGVGKSTVAAALALAWADAGHPVHLLSTDPAGSLTEVLGVPVGSEPQPLAGTNLTVQQLDAAAAWAAFRQAYAADVATTFARLLGPNVEARADQAVLERLVDLVPPGLDELMALLEVAERPDADYGYLVVDPAPTGHLLRLLAMPAVALEWVHAVLRLFLKYRRALGLGPVAERLLRVAEALKRLRAQLADPERTLPLVVAAPEALVVPETERLVFALRGVPTPPPWLLLNRWPEVPTAAEARHAEALRGLTAWVSAGRAPRWPEAPRGAEALRAFAATWALWKG